MMTALEQLANQIKILQCCTHDGCVCAFDRCEWE